MRAQGRGRVKDASGDWSPGFKNLPMSNRQAAGGAHGRKEYNAFILKHAELLVEHPSSSVIAQVFSNWLQRPRGRETIPNS